MQEINQHVSYLKRSKNSQQSNPSPYPQRELWAQVPQWRDGLPVDAPMHKCRYPDCVFYGGCTCFGLRSKPATFYNALTLILVRKHLPSVWFSLYHEAICCQVFLTEIQKEHHTISFSPHHPNPHLNLVQANILARGHTSWVTPFLRSSLDNFLHQI